MLQRAREKRANEWLMPAKLRKSPTGLRLADVLLTHSALIKL
jgi:hypothetical protein